MNNLIYIGIPHAEIVTFGDGSNDVNMIKNAHRGIAVANALDEVKKVADQIIAQNSEDSVVRFIAEDSGIRLV